MSEHVALAELLAYANGECSSADANVVFSHCTSCKPCGDELAVILALRQESRHAAPRRTGLAAAATVVILLGIGAAMVWLADREGATSALDAADRARLSTDAPPDATLAEFLYGDVVAASTNNMITTKKTGLQAIAAGRYEDAVALLEPLASSNPSDHEGQALLGIALYLNTGQPARTEQLLTIGAGLSREPLAHASQWYLANHYLRTAHEDNARTVLEALAAQPGTFGERATQLLARLNREDVP